MIEAPMPNFVWRNQVAAADMGLVRDLCIRSGNFSACEVELAVEVITDCWSKGGLLSGYHVRFLELEGETIGFACFGPTPCTESSWDLYWLAVVKELQGRGLGGMILEEVEAFVRDEGGRRLYIDTSGRPDYQATRGFYEKHDYHLAARLSGFYSEHDDKVIYVKTLN